MQTLVTSRLPRGNASDSLKECGRVLTYLPGRVFKDPEFCPGLVYLREQVKQLLVVQFQERDSDGELRHMLDNTHTHTHDSQSLEEKTHERERERERDLCFNFLKEFVQ